MRLVVAVVCLWAVSSLAEIQYQHPEEWQLWKTEHEKSYGSQREELERHIVWLANREYINAHNKNAHVLGFTLAMNHLGDIVRQEYSPYLSLFPSLILISTSLSIHLSTLLLSLSLSLD